MKNLAIVASILILSAQAFALDTPNSERENAEAALLDAQIHLYNIQIEIDWDKLGDTKLDWKRRQSLQSTIRSLQDDRDSKRLDALAAIHKNGQLEVTPESQISILQSYRHYTNNVLLEANRIIAKGLGPDAQKILKIASELSLIKKDIEIENEGIRTAKSRRPNGKPSKNSSAQVGPFDRPGQITVFSQSLLELWSINHSGPAPLSLVSKSCAELSSTPYSKLSFDDRALWAQCAPQNPFPSDQTAGNAASPVSGTVTASDGKSLQTASGNGTQ